MRREHLWSICMNCDKKYWMGDYADMNTLRPRICPRCNFIIRTEGVKGFDPRKEFLDVEDWEYEMRDYVRVVTKGDDDDMDRALNERQKLFRKAVAPYYGGEIQDDEIQ